MGLLTEGLLLYLGLYFADIFAFLVGEEINTIN
jgi:hypothetical protein